MNSSSVILLFHDPLPLNRSPYSFLFSCCAHLSIATLIAYGLITAPKLATPTQTALHPVRLLDLHAPHPRIATPSPSAEKNHTSQAGEKAVPHPSMPRLAAPLGDDPQTLVQADHDNTEKMQEHVPVPALLLWSKANRTDSKIEPIAPPHNSADIRHASLHAINQTSIVADQQWTPADSLTARPELDATHTAPVLLRSDTPSNELQQTDTHTKQPPNPANILSISELSMHEGTVALPSVSESASTATDAPSGALQQPANSDQTPAGDGTGSLVTHRLRQSPNGQYSMVVVGDSLEEQYPATASQWAGRVAYTVYLHVGTAHNWILQFSSSQAAEGSFEGNTMPLQAPWPVDIVVPSLDPAQVAADAVLIHGFITEAGIFDQLSIAYPENFSLSRFVLDALHQWHFRPSTLNGQPAKAEILLIIPCS